MPAPSTKDIRKPLLEAFKDDTPHGFVLNDFLEIIANAFNENLSEMSSIDKNLLRHKIDDAKTYLRKNGLLSHPSKSTYMITRKGLEVLEDNPDVIDDEYFAAKIKEKTLVEKINEASNEIVSNDVVEEPQPEPEPEPIVEEAPADFAENKFENAPEEFVQPENAPEETPEIQEAEEIAEPTVTTEPEENIEENVNEEIESEGAAEEVNNEVNETEENQTQEDYSMALNEDTEEEFEEPEEEEEEEQDEDIKLVYPEHNNEDDAEISQQKLDKVFEKYNSELANEVLTKVSELPSDKFEILVIDLLSKMGYFAFQTARYTTDSPGSELIHGVILDSNKPGSHPIYIQARKLNPEKTIGRSDMNDFAKALSEKGGAGIFATTAKFSEQAKIVATDERIMLIDGSRLASLMMANNFCVNVEKIFEVKAIDLDAFSEYED